jgi:hypothetical protein
VNWNFEESPRRFVWTVIWSFHGVFRFSIVQPPTKKSFNSKFTSRKAFFLSSSKKTLQKETFKFLFRATPRNP